MFVFGFTYQKKSVRVWHGRCLKKYLTELEGMLFAGNLKISTDEDEHATRGARGLAIDGGDVVLALLEGEGGELSDDVGWALDLLPLEGQHRTFLVQIRQSRSVRIESRVVVLDKRLRHFVWVHFFFFFFDPPSPLLCGSLSHCLAKVCDLLGIGNSVGPLIIWLCMLGQK